jgi:hypothetical protein
MSISYKFTKFEVKEIKKSERKYHSFLGSDPHPQLYRTRPTSKLEFHSTEAQKIKEEKIEESFGLGKKSCGTETDTET